MSKPQALIEQVRSSVAVELERRHAPTLLADRKAAKAAKHKAKHHKYTKAAFFRYCYYDPAFKFFCEQVLDVDYLPLPEATRAASEVGVQNSSDYVCTPFKHVLGDFAEALDLGADILIQFGGPCRLGYYGELQESILRDMGYEFIMMNFARGIELGYIGWAKEVLKTVNPNIDVPHGVVKLKAVAKMIEHLDSLRDFYLANAGFEVERGSFDAAWVSAMDAMRTCLDERDINEAYREAMAAFRAIPLAKPADPIRIGIVGEMFTAIDERSNLGLDHKLVAMGVEVHRMLNFTNRYLRYNEPAGGGERLPDLRHGAHLHAHRGGGEEVRRRGLRRPHPREERRVHAGDRLHPGAAEGERGLFGARVVPHLRLPDLRHRPGHAP